MSRKRNDFNDSLLLNNLTYKQYFNRLIELTMTRFKWNGLPLSVEERYLEKTLLYEGSILYFRDEVMGDLTLPFADSGTLDVYGYPTRREAFADNGYKASLTKENSVIIYNSVLHNNSILDIKMFARRLYNLDRIIDINCNAQKTPVVLLCDESQRLTILNLYKEIDGNTPVIKGTKNLDLDAIKVFKTDAPFVADKIRTLKEQTWNEALTYLGIPSVAFQKKERLISSEVNQMQGGALSCRLSGLNSRRDAVDKINAMFGTSITVDYALSLKENIDIFGDMESEEEDDNYE